MLFNSLDFAIFLPIVFIVYWFVCNRSIKAQNIVLVVASYIFYGWWDYRFLGLIAFSTAIDFVVGIYLYRNFNKARRKILLGISLFINLGLLGFFKYYNFFIENFIDAFTLFGQPIEGYTLNIILPVGISFYTFQTLSYSIDIYNRKIVPSSNFIAFATFVSFFPQLVAGPIERASNLLPQFLKQRQFKYGAAVDGLRQILWGLFKKVVIADNCAIYVTMIFNDYENYSGSTLLLGAVLFAFQIYGDFSGYSDMAIGTSRLFGFDLKQNFAFPYFSRDIAEFWRRWHISLSTWFRDYVYIPLGGSRGSKLNQLRNVAIIFIVSGFWHGANWTFIIWGLVCGILYVLFSLKSKKKHSFDEVNPNKLPTLRAFFEMGLVFSCMAFTRVLFRTTSMAEAIGYYKQVASFTFTIDYLGIYRYSFELIPLILILFWWEWYNRNKEFPLFSAKPELLKTMVVILLIVVFGNFEDVKQFYYFRF